MNVYNDKIQTMKFICNDGSELELLEDCSTVSKDTSPIKEILTRKNFSNYTFFDVEEVPLSGATQIQVNIIDVGVMVFIFKANDFDKESFINEVSKLKDIQLNSFYDVLNKVKALYQTVEAFNPLFAIYNPVGKWKIYGDCFKTINAKIKTIYVSDNSNSVAVKKDGSETETIKTNDSPKQKTKFQFVNPIPIIVKDKFHFLFAFIATLLIGFTLSIGIYDAYLGKMICVFFFICALAGSFLNFMIYKDTFKSNSIKSMYALLSVTCSILGIGISVAFYYLFKSITKDKPVIEPKLIMILGLMILIFLISSSMPLIVNYFKKRKK